MQPIVLTKNSDAIFSDCKKYRFALWRIWDRSKPLIMFIGLNPSTANETEDDPTIRRVKYFADKWGYGGVIMANLYAFATANPVELLIEERDNMFQFHLQDQENMLHLQYLKVICKNVVFAWGNFLIAKEKSKQIERMFPDALVLVRNGNGSPRHPLYVPGSVNPIKYF